MSVINNLRTDTPSAETIMFDSQDSGLASNRIGPAIRELSSMNRMYDSTHILVADNWEGVSVPFMYRLPIGNLTKDCNVIISLSDEATQQQVEEASECVIDILGYDTDNIIIIARANKPMINIPIVVSIGKLISVPEGRDGKYVTFTNTTSESWVTASNISGALNQIIGKLSTIVRSGSADVITVDDSVMQIGATNVQEVLEYLFTHGGGGNGESGVRREHETSILFANKWIGSMAPYTYILDVPGVTVDSDVDVGTIQEMSMEEFEALNMACIACGGTFNGGRLVVKAYGEKPQIDLPIDIITYIDSSTGTGSLGKYSGRRHQSVLLEVDNWIGADSPYIYIIDRPGVTQKSDIELGTDYNMTLEQFNELSNASIVCGWTSNDGKIYLKAYGEKPSINLRIDIIEYTTT